LTMYGGSVSTKPALPDDKLNSNSTHLPRCQSGGYARGDVRVESPTAVVIYAVPPPPFMLYARHAGKVLSFDQIVEEMKKMRSPFLETWVVAFIGLDHLKVVRVAPSGPAIDLEFLAELENAKKQPPFMKRGNRGMDPGFRSLGPAYLPIPRED
jgi:hypothetical protein